MMERLGDPSGLGTPFDEINTLLEGNGVAERFLQVELELNVRLKALSFQEPICYVYNPLEYAWDPHQYYVKRYCQRTKDVLFLGMNPGPFGMAQTGVPFGEVKHVKEWLQVQGQVLKPDPEHPKRPVLGLDCPQSEVSGARFWGFFKSLCGDPDTFFRSCFVHNICPLVFMTHSGKNLTPGELPAAQREQLLKFCDDALCRVVEVLGARTVIGVGRFAEQRARRALAAAGMEVSVKGVMHPSPRNPQANKGWDSIMHNQLQELQVLPLLKS
ncbi:single-strand selective monofunctional uracil DNA glycosylase [Microcaecilia unicolor]|uniref:Single-strand selective monofunctional uracil DNA glycosylase n=1 Tax=Microcaecilia unicolor TaxID=1415580 RepID=A0A6P7XU52_9AMPH|nr:single-strand selective monofunctional uracil DNA glycosylase [Microcaecilia unicolor]